MRRGSGLNTRSGSTRDGLADRIAFVKTYRPYSPEQSFLLPPSPRDWLPEGHLAIDGTKMKANASKHKAMSYERMVKDDARIRAEVEALLSQAEAVDAAEDEAEGAYDLQEEIRRREERLGKMAQVREALRRET